MTLFYRIAGLQYLNISWCRPSVLMISWTIIIMVYENIVKGERRTLHQLMCGLRRNGDVIFSSKILRNDRIVYVLQVRPPYKVYLHVWGCILSC